VTLKWQPFVKLCSPNSSTLEPDAALGNGGLGRLAACFMESMATLGIPAFGYGIRYDFGLFRQVISHGVQQEYPDELARLRQSLGTPRREVTYNVYFGGSIETSRGRQGPQAGLWHPGETVEAVAYDTPIVGWRGQHVNALRLWSARAPDPLRLDVFNTGDYVSASAEQARAEAICKFLYPNDESAAGRELRLRQEYFFVSASLQDLVKRHLHSDGNLRGLANKAAVQMNDTHPSLAIAELMRILVDQHNMRWDAAWQITNATLSYTNHTLLPEALETWPVELFQRLLPRHLEIIYASTKRISTAPMRRASRRHRLSRFGLDHRRDVRPPRAHGQSRFHRLAPHQRRVGDAFGADEGDRVPRSQPALSRPHHQQDQRHHLPPLADAGQSEAHRPVARHCGEPCSTIRRGSSSSKPLPATPRSSRNSARSSITTSSRSRA
jgi:glycogen/starch/alpha-glucan phosphorylase-like protein